MDAIKQGVLLIEPDRDLRSYYGTSLNSSGLFTMFITSNATEALHTIESSKQGDINIILLNSKVPDMPFHILLQKIRDHVITFQSIIYLFSNEITADDKFILKEMSVINVFKEKIEAITLIKTLKNNLKAKKNELNELKIYKLELYIKNEEISKCIEIMEDEKFKQFIESSDPHVNLQAGYLILIKEYEKCINLLNDFVRKKGDDLEISESMKVLNCLGKAYCQVGKYKDASIIFNKISEKSPKNFDYKMNLSSSYIGAAEWEKADNILKSILEHDPNNQEALLKRAQTQIGLNKPEEAKSFLEKIAGTVEFSSVASFFNNRGIAAIHEGNYEQAEGFYKNALVFAKKNSGKVLFNLGLALYKNNKIEEAKLIFNKIKDTNDAEYLSRSKNLMKQLVEKK